MSNATPTATSTARKAPRLALCRRHLVAAAAATGDTRATEALLLAHALRAVARYERLVQEWDGWWPSLYARLISRPANGCPLCLVEHEDQEAATLAAAIGAIRTLATLLPGERLADVEAPLVELLPGEGEDGLVVEVPLSIARVDYGEPERTRENGEHALWN